MDADVVIVGGGFAGLSAAQRAAELGLRALVLEQGAQADYACNSRVTGGIVHFAREGMMEPTAVLVDKAMQMTGGELNRELLAAMAGEARRCIEWLRAQGMKFVRIGPQLHYEWVLAPVRVARPGLEASGWKGRAGDTLLRLLTANFTRRGGQLLLDSRVTGLVFEDGRCIGVEATTQGRPTQYRAPAVVMADGGFQADDELVRRFISPHPEKLLRRNAGSGRGDALKMMEHAGARLVGTKYFYGHLHSRDALNNASLWPYPALDSLAVAGIVVNGRGERFADEGLGGVYLANAIAWSEDPLDTWVIFDEDIWRGPGKGELFFIAANSRLVDAKGTIFKADTLEALESAAGFPSGRLRASVDAHNAALAAGQTGAMQPPRSSGVNRPIAIRSKPFYAVPMCAGLTFTMGGAAVDSGLRVLKGDNSPIPGLYAVGKSLGGLEGGAPAGYVGGISLPVITGLRAAEAIAQANGKVA